MIFILNLSAVKKYILIISIFLIKINLSSAQITFTSISTPSTCSSNGSIIINASGGTSPYIYQIISSSNGIIRPAQNVSVFNNLPNGNYTIRITDAINVSTTNVVSIAGNYIPLTFSYTQQQSTIKIIPLNGRSPYKFTYSIDGGFTYNTPIDSGVYNCIKPGNYYFRVYDSCGNFYTEPIIVQQVIINANFSCINNNTAIVLNNISGGNGNYTYHASGNGYDQTNTTGNFSGFTRCNKNVVIEVTDQCIVKKTFTGCSSPDYSFNISCVNFNNKTVTLSNILGGNGVPYQFIANNLVSNSTFIQNIPNSSDSIIVGITDSCGYRNTIKIEKFRTGKADTNVCENGAVKLSSWYKIDDINTSFPPTIYTSTSGPTTFSVKDSLGVDSSSVFVENLQTGNYTYKVTNACGDEVTGSFSYNKNCYKKITLQKIQSCNELRLKVIKDCTTDTNVLYTLMDLNNTIISQNSFGIFYGLNNDSCYKIAVKDIDCDTTIYDYINPIRPKLRLFQNSCNETTIAVSPTINKICGPALGAAFAGTLTYIFTDSVYNILQTSITNIINPVPSNTYWVYAVSNGCNSDTLRYIRQSGFTDTINFCITPSVKFVGNSCKISWQVKMINNIRNINFHLVGNGVDLVSSNTFTGVDSGRYYLKDGCNEQELFLPNYYNFKTSINPGCPSNASITASTLIDTAYINSLKRRYFFEVCSPPIIDYNIKEVGTSNSLIYSVNGIFSNLKTGTFYGVYFKGNTSCNFHADTIFTPFYTRPAVTATYGLICNGNNASVKTTVTGGTPPYKYEVLNSSEPVINTDSNYVLYNNLPLGIAEFRVSDACGISTNYSTEVLSVNFEPTFKKKCDGTVQLIAPDIFNTTYIWTNKNGDTIGRTPIITAIPNGNDTFKVIIKHLTCTLNKSLYVNNFSASIANANAGANFTVDTAFTNLNGNTPPSTAIGFWKQIDPSSGNSIFADINNPKTKVIVDNFPGQYTYVWTLRDTLIGCISEDTVVVSFLRCPNITNVLYNKNIIPATCKDGAQISINITQTATPIHYLWNNGDTTSTINNLKDSVYIVLITDETSCTPDIYDTTYLARKITTFDTLRNNLCNGDSLIINNKKYLTSGNFTDTLLNSVGCDSILTIQITLLDISKTFDTLIFCEGESYTLPNAQVVTQTGNYVAKFSNSIGCDSLKNYNITFNVAQQNTIDTSICIGFSYQLPKGNIVSQAGIYIDSFKTKLGCDSIITTKLFVKNTLIPVFIGFDTTVCQDNELLIALTYPNYVKYLWQDSSTQSNFTINKEGIYYVKVYDGCTETSDTINIKTKDCSCLFYVPTAFSPNNDGNNDVFMPFNKCAFFTNYSFKVFNRWSELLFQTDDSTISWNGFYKNELQQVDSYVWYLEYFDILKNENIKVKGTVRLIQ